MAAGAGVWLAQAATLVCPLAARTPVAALSDPAIGCLQMTYQVLARKWRPRRFSELVGQAHVKQALINALDGDRLHHAYLFTGTRGVGKTTLARLFAKAINCEQGVSSEPCGVCSACAEVDAGRFVDLIEVDAASRTKVDDTRDLLDNVQFAATAGRFKVYLIDEVHMFSNHSFNALLKTLEEPPAHVKFLLATTEPKKLPVTILSRCLQFNLSRLSRADIAGHLAHVLAEEGIEFEPAALNLLADGAQGSARDALSLLDQAIAHCGGRITEAGVAGMLGSIRFDDVAALIEALLAQDGRQLIASARALVTAGATPESIFAELLAVLTRCAVTQFGAESIDVQDDGAAIAALAGRLDSEQVQLWYQIALHARRDIELAPDAQSGLEMGLIRMLAFMPETLATGGGGARLPGAEPGMPQAQAGATASATNTSAANTPAANTSAANTSAANTSAATPTPSVSVAAAVPEAGRPAARTPRSAAGTPDENANLATAVPEGPAFAPPVGAHSAQPKASVDARRLAASAVESPVFTDGGDDALAVAWAGQVAELGLEVRVRALAEACAPESLTADLVCLQIAEAHAVMARPEIEQALAAALAEHAGHAVALRLNQVPAVVRDTPLMLAQRRQAERQRAAEAAAEADPMVQALVREFDARIEAVRPRPDNA